mgnify:CR=1 FL=1
MTFNGGMLMTKWFKGCEWIYFVYCIVFCIYSFTDKEYVLGVIFTILTIVATVNTIKSNIRRMK